MDIYLIKGLYFGGKQYSPYKHAILLLSRGASDTSGTLEPLLGDKTPQVRVHGSSLDRNHLKLTFFAPGKDISYVFTRNDKKDKLQWSYESDSEQTYVKFFKLRTGSFSDSALTLFQESCGPEYGEIGFAFRSAVSPNDIDELYSNDEYQSILSIPGSYYVDDKDTGRTNGKSTIGDILKHFASSGSEEKDDWGHYNFNLPIGFESLVVKKFRENDKLFSYANLAWAGCGGGEIAFATVDRRVIFSNSNFDEKRFEAFLDTSLTRFASKDGRQFEICCRNIIPQPLPGALSRKIGQTYIYQSILAVDSKVSRQVEGYWDLFKINISPFASAWDAEEQFSLSIEIEDLRTVQKVRGPFAPKRPPDQSYFATRLTSQDEGVATTALAHFIARAGDGKCFFVSDSADSNAEVKCDRSIDDRE
jgi:hypothetical protein